MECFICVEAYNRHTHKKISCPYCEYESCRNCWKTYLLQSVKDPHCMNCQKSFSRDIVQKNFTKNWTNTVLKQHRENILVDREKALLPVTQPYVDKIMSVDKKIKNIDKSILERRKKIDELEQQIREIEIEVNIFNGNKFRYERMKYDYATIELKEDDSDNEDVEVKKERNVRFVRKCPQNDCRGFLSTQYKCSICETWVCPKCNGIKKEKNDDDHKCDPNDVETVKYLRSQTKPCPNCGMGIQKISGCDQMFCTSCHIAFSWNTGQIVHGRIHNPHFYEWKREQGTIRREPGDIPCGGLPYVNEVKNTVMEAFNIQENKEYDNYGWRRQRFPDHPKLAKFLKLHRLIEHIQNVELRRYQVVENIETENRDLRIKYMLKDVCEDFWKKELQKKEKAREKKVSVYQILDMYSQTMSDFFRGMVRVGKEEIEDIEKQMDHLKDYVNNQFEVLRKMYNNVIPRITDDYEYSNN